MNIYVVVEGTAESIIYPNWIPLVNPLLSRVNDLSQIRENNFYLISARGYPNIFSVIDSAIEDITQYPLINRLVIAVDSDDMTRDDKHNEFSSYLARKEIPCETRIIIQHFCVEAWALGNRRIIRPQPLSEKTKKYRRLFDVRTRDPELLPDKPDEGLNRAQFAEKYLRLILNETRRTLSYSKSRPYPVSEKYYFNQVKSRFYQTTHIRSFHDFITAFS